RSSFLINVTADMMLPILFISDTRALLKRSTVSVSTFTIISYGPRYTLSASATSDISLSLLNTCSCIPALQVISKNATGIYSYQTYVPYHINVNRLCDATIRVDICFLSAMEDMIELPAPNNTFWFYEPTNS